MDIDPGQKGLEASLISSHGDRSDVIACGELSGGCLVSALEMQQPARSKPNTRTISKWSVLMTLTCET